MTEEQYQNILSKLRGNPDAAAAVGHLTRIATRSTVIGYILLLAVLGMNGQYEELYHSILVPGVSFVIVSIARRLIRAKRPYEIYRITPLLEKDSTGNSFPSRHVFSIFVIAMTFLVENVWLGIIFLALGVILAVCRVVSGLHFIRDVICGAAIGVAAGLIGYYVIF